MVEGGLLLRSQSEVDSALSSDPAVKSVKRRKKRKRNSSAVDSGIKLDESAGNDDDDSWSDTAAQRPVDELVEREKLRLFEYPRNSIYHRCPVKQCTFKTLRADDNCQSIMDHMKVIHNTEFVVFNRTRFSHADVQCELCRFWFRNKAETERHYALDCDMNSTYPDMTYRLDVLFDLSILANDYNYAYHGITQPSPESSNLIVSAFWAQCHACDKKCNEPGEMMSRHITKHDEATRLVVAVATLENEWQVAPSRCVTCNWIQLGNHQKHSCTTVLDTIEELMASGKWGRVSLKTSFRKAQLQDIDDIIGMRRQKTLSSLQCVACGEKFDKIERLDDHVKTHHTLRVWVSHNQRLTQHKPFFCQQCHFCFNTEQDFMYHLQTRYCEFNQSSSYSNLRAKIASIVPGLNRLTKAEMEGAANFDSVKKMRKQKRTNYALAVKRATDELPFPCFVCEREFSESSPFHAHLRQMHGIDTWLQYKSIMLPTQPFRCSKCCLCFPSVEYRHDCDKYQEIVAESTFDLNNQAVLDGIAKRIQVSVKSCYSYN